LETVASSASQADDGHRRTVPGLQGGGVEGAHAVMAVQE
jgi:hypothetical protein